MPTVTYKQIWDNHPYPAYPCDDPAHTNQCAIRMGVALRAAGVNLSTFHGAKCWSKHDPRHILRAQELATWMTKQPDVFGKVQTFKKKVTEADFAGKTGLVFIQDGWGPTDHLDVWDGSFLKGGQPNYFSLGAQVWFWEL